MPEPATGIGASELLHLLHERLARRSLRFGDPLQAGVGVQHDDGARIPAVAAEKPYGIAVPGRNGGVNLVELYVRDSHVLTLAK